MIGHNDLRLLFGLPIDIQGVGQIHPLKLIDIVNIDEEKYNDLLLPYVVSTNDLLESEQFDIYTLSTYDVVQLFCMHDDSFRKTICDSIKVFFQEDTVEFIPDIGVFFLGEIEEQRVIHPNNFNVIRQAVLIQNCIQEPMVYKPANESARKFIEEMKQNQRKKAKPKSFESRLFNIISAVSCDASFEEILGLTIYQLYNKYYRQEMKMSYQQIMNGVYFGTVDKSKLNMKDIHWSRPINF